MGSPHINILNKPSFELECIPGREGIHIPVVEKETYTMSDIMRFFYAFYSRNPDLEPTSNNPLRELVLPGSDTKPPTTIRMYTPPGSDGWATHCEVAVPPQSSPTRMNIRMGMLLESLTKKVKDPETQKTKEVETYPDTPRTQQGTLLRGDTALRYADALHEAGGDHIRATETISKLASAALQETRVLLSA